MDHHQDASRWYADPENWVIGPSGRSPAQLDGGDRARAAFARAARGHEARLAHVTVMNLPRPLRIVGCGSIIDDFMHVHGLTPKDVVRAQRRENLCGLPRGTTIIVLDWPASLPGREFWDIAKARDYTVLHN